MPSPAASEPGTAPPKRYIVGETPGLSAPPSLTQHEINLYRSCGEQAQREGFQRFPFRGHGRLVDVTCRSSGGWYTWLASSVMHLNATALSLRLRRLAAAPQIEQQNTHGEQGDHNHVRFDSVKRREHGLDILVEEIHAQSPQRRPGRRGQHVKE
jgi:hypothetical protein